MSAVREARFPSEALGGPIDCLASVPEGAGPFPVVYLLHGRGDSAGSWRPVLDELAERRQRILIAPDAPWSERAGYYVDSAYTTGRPVESALLDLVAAVDADLPTIARRESRTVAGYSMGGAGAVRLGLAHPDLFGAVIALSPAVYVPGPPAGSSAREFGAFGVGDALFDPERYAELAYPAALARYPAGLPLRLVVAAGDAEPNHEGALPELRMAEQAERLARGAARVPGIDASFALYPGGHDFGVWRPALLDALEHAT